MIERNRTKSVHRTEGHPPRSPQGPTKTIDSNYLRTRPSVARVFSLDMVLLHAPSVWDFRDEVIIQGPLADVIPSTTEFEMYPIGLTSIASYLEANSYNVRLVNLAYRMLKDPGYDVQRRIAALRAPVFGIDLHWLPHANGALGIAELVKQIHPGSKVLLGGLSASYFHEELMTNPAVDFVLRGDSTEEPCRQLLHALRTGSPLDNVENLTWRRDDGTVVVNALTFVPSDLDWIDVPAYEFMLHAVFKYRSLGDFLPYLEWLRYPSTMLLNSRGCTFDCAICGGSRSAYEVVAGRQQAGMRSPEKLVADARLISTFSRAPIFLVHDPRVGGIARGKRIFELFAASGVRNELVIETFFPADSAFFSMVDGATKAWSLQITIESPDPQIRKVNGKFGVSNEAVERTLEAALDAGCQKLDLFFMVGLSGQTPAKALETVDYCRHLVERFGSDKRLQFYVAPLGPFLDPGSRAFEHPTELGFHPRFTTLTEHRQALLGPTWADMLSFETDWMSRDEIVSTTYQVGRQLNDLKFDSGLIDKHTHDTVDHHLTSAVRVLAEVQAMSTLPEPERRRRLRSVALDLGTANTESLVGVDELKWKTSTGIRVSWLLIRTLARAVPRELAHAYRRLLGHYDNAIANPQRLPSTTAPDLRLAKQAPVAESPRDLGPRSMVGSRGPEERDGTGPIEVPLGETPDPKGVQS